MAAARLEARLDRLLARPYRTEANRRLAQHLRHEQPHLFTFLRCPGLEATNNAAERALRGVVIAREVWGGNHTWNGARTHGILTSVLRTCRQQGQDTFALLVELLRSPAAQVLDIVPSGRSP
jgi:transposase